MAVYLTDLLHLAASKWISDRDAFDAFCEHSAVSALGWPLDVVRQMLWEHAATEHFVPDYGSLDLCGVAWNCERMPAALFDTVETGASDSGSIEEYAREPEYWANLRGKEVAAAWKDHGTWSSPPLLIARALLTSQAEGWQLVEGRTRVGVLRGRRSIGLRAAATHETWVGTPR